MILRRIHIELWGVDRLIIGLCRKLVHKERRIVFVLVTLCGVEGKITLIEICSQVWVKELLRKASLWWIVGRRPFFLLELLIEVLALYVSRVAETTL